MRARLLLAALGAALANSGAWAVAPRACADAAPAPAAPVVHEATPLKVPALCAVSARDAVAAVGKMLIVDTRPRAAVERGWVPGAARLAVHEIDGSVLVKTAAHVALFGEDSERNALYQACASLRRGGLADVRVIVGGARAWRRAGGGLAGDWGDGDAATLLTASDLLRLRGSGDIAWVLVQRELPPDLQRQGDSRISARGPDAAIAQLSRQPGSSTPAPVVVMLGRADQAPRWQAAFRAQAMPDPLFFVDSAQSLAQAQTRLRSIAANAYKPLPSSCGRDR